MSDLTKFDEIIKGVFDDYEMPYEPGEWTKLQSRMNPSAGVTGSSGFAAALGAVVVLSGSLLLFSGSLDTKKNSTHFTSNESGVVMEPSITVNPSQISYNTLTETIEGTGQNINSNEEELLSLESNKDYSDFEIEKINGLKDRLGALQNEVLVTVYKEKIDDSRAPKTIVEEVLPFKNESDATDFIPAVPEYTKSRICVGVELEFEAFTMNDDIEFEWNFGDGKMSSSAKPVHTYDQPGEYHVTLISRSKSNPDLVKEHPNPVVITVLPSPEIDFQYFTDDNKSRPVTTLEAQGSDKYSYYWDLGNGSKSTSKVASIVYSGAKTFDVSLTASNKYNCKTIRKKTVYLPETYNLLAPNAMTPNGDGLNDSWFPKALSVLDYPFELNIYDRSGILVYNTRAANPWNGINQYSGQNCTEGHYIWHIELINEKGQKEEYQGTIYLSK